MAYEEFDGELDKPTEFVEFTGQLDTPESAAEPDAEVVTSARAWRGAGAGRGSATDPRRTDAPNKSGSVLEGVRMEEPQFDSAEAGRLSNRKYAESAMTPDDPRRNAPSMTAATDKLIPINESGVMGRAADLVGSQVVSYAAGLGRKAGDAVAAVGAAGAGAAMNTRAGDLQARADRTQKSVSLSADGAWEKYAPQILSVFPTMAVAAVSGGLPIMFGVAEVQSYAESRQAGLSPLEALGRAVPMGAAEVLGEKLGGTGKLLDALEKVAAKGATTDALKELGKRFATSGMREVPSEEATYAMQFGVDKLPGVGLNQDAGVAEFIEGAKDTAIVAAGAGSAMGAAGAAASRIPTRAPQQTAMELAQSKGFLVPEAKPAGVTSFSDPAGPVARAGITPVVIPTSAGANAPTQITEAPNVSAPTASGRLADGGADVGGDNAAPGVASAGRTDAVESGGSADASLTALSGNGITPVRVPSGEPTAAVNPVKGTSDTALLSRLPMDEAGLATSAPETTMMARSGAGYATKTDATVAMQIGTKRQPELSWKIEPIEGGRFRVAGYAQPDLANPAQVADTAQGDGVPVATQPETIGDIKQKQASVEKLARDVAASGADASEIELVQSRDIQSPAQSGAATLIGHVAAAVRSAFGTEVITVRGLAGLGAAHGGKAYVNIDEVSVADKNSVQALIIGTIGHEAGHAGLEKSADPQDRQAFANLKQVIAEHLHDGIIDRQHDFENAEAKKAGSAPVTREYAHNEVLQNINGAMWLDPKFWSRLAEIDNGSTMRRVAYHFMQAATKLIKAARGTDLDIDTLVKNRDAVREIVAKVWAEKAMRNGRPASRTGIAKLLDEPPTDLVTAYKRKGVIGEVAPNPDQPVVDEWRAMSADEKTTANRDVGRKVAQGVMDLTGQRGWDVTMSTGTYEGETNPNFIIEAPDDATDAQVEEFARLVGYVLDQKAMVTFDEDSTSGPGLSGFVKVVLPAGMPESKIKELRAKIGASAKAAGDDTLRDGALVFGNFRDEDGKSFSGLEDEDFRSQIEAAVGQFEYDGGEAVVMPVQRFKSELIWPDNRDGYLQGTRYEGNDQALEAGRDDVRGRQGSDIAQLRKLAEEATGRRQRWIDNSTSGRARAAVRHSAESERHGSSGDFAEYGQKREGVTPVVGTHFSQIRRASISSVYYGTGLKGAERERLSDPKYRDIRSRIYFYVDNGKGIHPEAGVGGIRHTIRLNNLYNINKDPAGYRKMAKGDANKWERLVMQAGYDGYVADTGGHQAFAVLVGKHDVPVYKRKTTGAKDDGTDRADAGTESRNRSDSRMEGTVNESGARAESNLRTGGAATNAGRGRTVEGAARRTAEENENGAVPQDLPPESESAAQARRAENLKRFLGGSVMQKDDGSPIVMYHGTGTEFTVFRAKQADAIFLTTNRSTAKAYSNDSVNWMADHYDQFLAPDQILKASEAAIKTVMTDWRESMGQRQTYANMLRREGLGGVRAIGGAREAMGAAVRKYLPIKHTVMPLIVRAERPFDYKDKSQVDAVVAELARRSDGGDISIASATGVGAITGTAGEVRMKIRQGDYAAIESPDVQPILRGFGHDSFWVKEGKDRNLAVYSSNQVKHAVNNNGEYDLGNPDIRYKRRARQATSIDDINELGNFNVDAQNAEDYDLDFTDSVTVTEGTDGLTPGELNAKMEAKLTDRLREELEFKNQLMAKIEDELRDEGFGVIGSPRGRAPIPVSQRPVDLSATNNKAIKVAGIMAEEAYPDLNYRDDVIDPAAQIAPFSIAGKSYTAKIRTGGSPTIGDAALADQFKDTPLGMPLPHGLAGLSESAKVAWNKRFSAGADLFRRGFDLYTAVPADARARVLKAWQQIAEKPGAFEFNRDEKPSGKSVEEVAQGISNKMLAGTRYSAAIDGHPRRAGNDVHDGFQIILTDKKTGDVGTAEIEYRARDKRVVVHAEALGKGSSMGKPVYQIAQAFASAFKSTITSHELLMGVNNYRRTEQMFSGALRSGNIATMQPGVGQRIYGWNERAKDQTQQDRNLVRVALASARNAAEFAPDIKHYAYDLATDEFVDQRQADTPRNRAAAADDISQMLRNADAREASISRSTLARAAVTFDAIEHEVTVPDAVAKPVLYKRKQRQLDERLDVKPILEELSKALATKGPTQIDRLMQRIAVWRTKFDAVNEGDFQDELISIGGRAVKMAVDSGVSQDDKSSVPIPIGATPHALRMLGLDMAPLRIDSRIVGKILMEKHGQDFAGISADDVVRAIYEPVLITSTQARDEYEIITNLTSKEGGYPLMFAIRSNAVFQGQRGENGERMKPLVTHAVMSAYEKPSFWVVQLREAMRSGKLLYANVGALQALESKNPALGRVLSQKGNGTQPKTSLDASRGSAEASLPSTSDGESPPLERANVSIGSARTGLVAPSASRLTKDIAKSVMTGNVKGYGDLVNWVSENYRGDGDQMPSFKRSSRAPGLPGESKFMAFRRVMQDQFIQVRELQDMLTKRGGTVGEAQDVYRAEERSHGRVQALLIDFSNHQIKPFIDKVAAAGFDINDVALYAYALHAKERNAYISSINSKIGDAGSGMSDIDADNIVQMAQLSGDKAALDDLQQDLMGIAETTRRVLLDEGLITQEEYDGWSNLYQNYVPLRGFENVDPEDGTPRPGAGRGFSMTGKESIKALGRKSRAGDIIENIVRDYERAVIRSERNSVAKTFLDLATSNPDPSLWEVQPVKINRSFNKASGMVLMSKAPDTGDDTVAIKVAGQSVRVKIHDELFLRAMKLAGKDETSQLERLIADTLGTYTNLMRNTLTRYNPIFGAINAVRDGQMGAVSVFDELGAKGLKLYTKYYTPALAASWRSERDNASQTKVMDRWMQEMRFAGGSTGGYHMRDVSEINESMRTMLLAAGAQPHNWRESVRGSKAWQGAAATMKWLEIIGATSEDAARVAAYRAAREMGKTPAEAASISKNLTTNFNRKGEWGTTINGLYLFFNAAVQGSTRVLEALQNPKVRYMMAGVTAAAMGIALANASAGDDDDGQPYWDKIPAFEKERNMIFMLPPGVEMEGSTKIGTRGRYIKVPMPYGINVFPVLGNQLADLARHAKDPSNGAGPAKAAINMMSAVFGSINPFGGALDPTKPVELGMALAPTAADLVIQLATGTNAFGRPVGPEKSPFDDKPDSENFSARQAGTASQNVARWLNSVTGGNEARSGAIDLMPGTLDNLVRNTTGGFGVFLADTFVNLPTKIMSPVETTSRDIPLARNFFGQIDEVTDIGLFYDRRSEVAKEADAAKAEMKLGIPVEYSDEQLAKMALAKSAESLTKIMSMLRKREIEIAADANMTKGEKQLARREIEAKRASIAQAFNTAYVDKQKELAEAK